MVVVVVVTADVSACSAAAAAAGKKGVGIQNRFGLYGIMEESPEMTAM